MVEGYFIYPYDNGERVFYLSLEILPYNRLALHLIYGFANKIPNFIPHSPITHSIQSTHRIRSGPQRDVGMGGFFIARTGSKPRLKE